MLRWSLAGIRQRYPRRYLGKRLGNLVIIFFVTMTINFVLPRLEPGNFAQLYLYLLTSEVHNISPETQAALVHQLTVAFGLDQPIWVQFVKYWQQLLLVFPPNFGFSFEYYPTQAWEII